MTNLAVLNFGSHRFLRLSTRYGPELGDGLGMVSVVPSEIPALVNSYPLLFRKTPAGAYELGAVLGFAGDENLFLKDGGWDAAYVPLKLRCEPFSVQESAATPDRNTLMIDLDSPRLGKTGDILFFADGRPSERLQAIVDALEALVKGVQLGLAYAAALDALGLIEPVDIKLDLGRGPPQTLSGLFGLAPDRLASLPDPALLDLHRRGFLAWTSQQAASIGQIGNLILRKNHRGASHGA
jgi:hypothetical protein